MKSIIEDIANAIVESLIKEVVSRLEAKQAARPSLANIVDSIHETNCRIDKLVGRDTEFQALRDKVSALTNTPATNPGITSTAISALQDQVGILDRRCAELEEQVQNTPTVEQELNPLRDRVDGHDTALRVMSDRIELLKAAQPGAGQTLFRT